jgi:hypothetical protein
VFTARYALSSYIKQIRFVFKGLIVCLRTYNFSITSTCVLFLPKYKTHILREDQLSTVTRHLKSPLGNSPTPHHILVTCTWTWSERCPSLPHSCTAPPFSTGTVHPLVWGSLWETTSESLSVRDYLRKSLCERPPQKVSLWATTSESLSVRDYLRKSLCERLPQKVSLWATTSEAVVKACVSWSVHRFGYPHHITTYRGLLFKTLASITGSCPCRTAAWHPALVCHAN